jgi:hypothetical protein
MVVKKKRTRSKMKRVKRVKRTKRSLKRRSFKNTKKSKRTQINRRTKRTKRKRRTKRMKGGADRSVEVLPTGGADRSVEVLPTGGAAGGAAGGTGVDLSVEVLPTGGAAGGTGVDRSAEVLPTGGAAGGTGVTHDGATGDSPGGICFKKESKTGFWKKKYVKIEGNSLNVYLFKPVHSMFQSDGEPRGSSISDLTGATVRRGSISWSMIGLATEYPDDSSGTYYLLTIDYLEGGRRKTAKFAFTKPPFWVTNYTLVDDIQNAIQNISEGRPWNLSEEEQSMEIKERVRRERVETEGRIIEEQKINCLENIAETELSKLNLEGLIKLRFSLETKYSHLSIKKLNVFSGFKEMINQFDRLGPLKYDPYKFCGEDSYYLSLLQKFDIKPTTARGGSAIILTATSKDTILDKLKCDFLGYNHDKGIEIYLRWVSSPVTDFSRLMNIAKVKHKLYNMCNTITSLYFPAYARCVEIVTTPQPFLTTLLDTEVQAKQLPILFEALLYEGETCKGWDASIKEECNEGDYSQAQQKPLAMLHETILKGFLYPLGIIEHENKARNFTSYEPMVGDNYLFILNTTNNLKLFSCKVTPGVKFRMVIDIENTRFPRTRPPDLLLQESLTEFAGIMGIEKLQLEGEETLENFERGLEHVFDTCSSYLKEEHMFDLDSEYENTHIFVVDSLSWWNLSMPCLVNITQASEENLQYLVNHKFLIQLLPIMIQSKDNEHKKELLKTNPEINLLIQKLPENIRDIVAELIITKNYDFTDLMELIPGHIEPLMVQLFE